MKRCSRCSRLLSIDNFPPRLDGKGLTCQCYKCWEHIKQWRISNPERYKENSLRNGRKNRPKYKSQRHEYYLRNRKEKILNARKWKLLNREKVRKINSKSYFKNRTTIAKRHRLWRKNNPSKVNSYASGRRARERATLDGDTRKIDAVYKRASELRKYFDVHVDHVVPIARGGTHTADNLQIIYAFENRRKNRFLNYKPKIVFR